ncbi:hypothetical protein [Modestobacter sp. SYSU DS0511]
MSSAAPDTLPSSQLSSRRHHLPAALAVVVAAALLAGLPELLGTPGRVAAIAVLQLALVAGWVVATGIRGAVGSVLLGVLAAAGADVALLLPERPELDGLLVVLGLGFLAAVVHQMTRPAPRLYLVASLAGVLLLLCSVCALAVQLGVARIDDGPTAATTGAIVVGTALVVGHLVDLLLPRPLLAPGVPRGLVGLVLAVLAGVAVALLAGGGGPLVEQLWSAMYGATLAGVATLTAVGASYVVVERGEPSWGLPVVQALLPFAAAAPFAYALTLYATG